ncbi:MAG: transcriptional regulator [Lachnospiraceae bacterium]|nr:transcriptional regulator [Lachnospiraceae bacterium]
MLLGVKEVMSLLGIGRTQAYKYIAELNQELEEKGYLTVKGKVPKKYLEKRFGLGG